LSKDHSHQSWFSPPSGNGTALVVLNEKFLTQKIDPSLANLPDMCDGGRYNIKDVWSGNFLYDNAGHPHLQVESHDTKVLP